MLMSPASQIRLVVQSPTSSGRVTCLPPKNASAPWGGPGSRWLITIVRQVSYIQYLLTCQKSQRSTPHNIVKSALAWCRVFHRRHLGRRVTAVTCLRWPTVDWGLCMQRKPLVSYPGMHHGMCMSGLLTRGGGENFPGIAFPAHVQPAILRIWQKTFARKNVDFLSIASPEANIIITSINFFNDENSFENFVC